MKTTILAALAVLNLLVTGAVAIRLLTPSDPNEVFADRIMRLEYDGHVFRATLGIERVGRVEEGRPAEIEKRPVSRLILTPDVTKNLCREAARLSALTTGA